MGCAESRTKSSKSWRGPCPGCQALALGNADEAAAGTDGDAFAERLLAPAQADHVVEFGPVQECIIGGMKDYQTAAAADVGLQRLLHVARPASARRRCVRR